jgi:hypothetical protein
MSRLAIALALAFLSLPALAQQATATQDIVTWTAPTQYEDGTNLPSTDIKEYVVRWGTAPGTYPNVVRVTATTATVVRLPPYTGTRCYVVATVTTLDLESDLSNEVCKTVRRARALTISIR